MNQVERLYKTYGLLAFREDYKGYYEKQSAQW